jgi:hypothetical protein
MKQVYKRGMFGVRLTQWKEGLSEKRKRPVSPWQEKWTRQLGLPGATEKLTKAVDNSLFLWRVGKINASVFEKKLASFGVQKTPKVKAFLNTMAKIERAKLPRKRELLLRK